MNQRLMERVKTKFVEFCESHQISDPQRYIENRVWHNAFDPNVEASDIELTNLNPQPVATRPETFRSYLNRSAVVADKTLQPESGDEEKLKALSERTGISIATLRQVKSVERSVNQQRAQLN
jgi:hypothetical protein